jgi:putative MATE family efflux protein
MGMDFTQGNITVKLIKFVGPLLMANILNSLYNTVDMIIIGQYVGSTGTVAVSLGGKMLMFLTMIGMGLSNGGQVLIAQQAGAKQHDQIKYSIGTLFSLLGIISLACCLICLLLSRRIIGWLNTPPEAFDAALAYLRITSIGLPLMFGYTAISSVLRGMGDSKNPLLFIAIAATFNLILDIVFIVNLNLGAAGTALATVIGQGVSLVISVMLLYKKRRDLGFDFKPGSFAIDREKCRIILRIGLPMAAQSGLIQVTQLFIMSYVNMFGLVQAAAYGIGDKIIHLLNVVQQSMMQGGSAMTGQNIGAGKLERVKKLVWTVLGVNIGVTVVVSFFTTLLFPGAVFSLFTKDPLVLAYSFSFMIITAACLFLSSIMGAFSGVTTGTGNAKLSFLAGFLDGVIFRIAFSFLFGFALHMEVTGFFLGNTLARLGPIVVHCPYYFSGAWKRRKRLVAEEPVEEPPESTV